MDRVDRRAGKVDGAGLWVMGDKWVFKTYLLEWSAAAGFPRELGRVTARKY